MRRTKNIIQQILGIWGLKLTRIHRASGLGPHSTLFQNRKVTDLNNLVELASPIPGMLTEEAGKCLFTLCYTQQLQGDVIEIGSWQGYSTSFLARAVAESGNGRMYAIDHFKGNVGKEDFYAVERPDLGDLQGKFRENMQRLNLAQTVRLLPMSNREAADQLRIESAQVRFLFIDGDHSREGVQRDMDLFFPFLMKGAIVVFDDCSPSAPGVIEAVDRLFQGQGCQRAFAFSNTAVVVI
jgi:predicted O-methyltransferase YrrM